MLMEWGVYVPPVDYRGVAIVVLTDFRSVPFAHSIGLLCPLYPDFINGFKLARHLYALIVARRDGSFAVKGEIKVAKTP